MPVRRENERGVEREAGREGGEKMPTEKQKNH